MFWNKKEAEHYPKINDELMRRFEELKNKQNHDHAIRSDSWLADITNKYYEELFRANLVDAFYSPEDVSISCMETARKFAATRAGLHDEYLDGLTFAQWLDLIQDYNREHQKHIKLYETLWMRESISKEAFADLVKYRERVGAV